MATTNPILIPLQDGDFQTLRKLLSQNALGKIAEAEIHYDFESPFWTKYMTETKYVPGQGHSFGLGRQKSHPCNLVTPFVYSHQAQSPTNSCNCQGSHSLDQAYTLFGRPASITAVYRSQRGIESEIEDSFTIILHYGRDQKNLLVTVKSAITTPLAKQLKFLVRGSEGSFVKVRCNNWRHHSNSYLIGLHN